MYETGSGTAAGRQQKTDYSIWSLAFCQVDIPQDFMGGAGLFSNQGLARAPMLYTVLIGGEVGSKQHIAMVDCGFRNDYWMDRYPFSGWEDPTEVLARVGVTPEDVEVILVSHMHFDHMGNFEAFPNAQLVIQIDEYLGWSEAVCNAQHLQSEEDKAWVFSSFDPTDLVRAAAGVASGRVRFIRGDEEVLPGVTARLAKDSHTFGSQWFSVETANGPYAIAGDTVYWYSNVERMWPPGYNQGNPFNLLKVYQSMRHELKGETSRIIPGHDPAIRERHPSWITASGNETSEINLRDGDQSRRPTPK